MPVNTLLVCSVGGVKVSIVAFQAIDPGSIPGWRTCNFFKFLHCHNFLPSDLLPVLGNTRSRSTTPATQLVTYTLLTRANTLLNILLRNSLLYSNITQEYRKILANHFTNQMYIFIIILLICIFPQCWCWEL